TIRPATTDDVSAILNLHQESINDHDLSKSLEAAGLEVPADLQHFSSTYIGSIHNRFWVAVVPEQFPSASTMKQTSGPHEQVIGMVGVVATKTDVAEMRRLRVTPSFRRQGIAGRLLRAALAHCRDQGFLKVLLDARLEQTAAVQLFEREGFQFSRNRESAGVQIREFYLDLYGSD
ncbi:MAG: GNAT family N-acetyltransferase, partial [Planctomycetota bacterium]|nr:GNAT family N-acetyltransferase [Planctomycetota bacterium]